MYDIMIRNARIVDGTGAPWYYGDLGVQGGMITAMGRLGGQAARETVEADGLVLAPGFIDLHSHTDSTLPEYALGESRLFQGITTEIGGNCGMSMAPAQPETLDLLKDYMGQAPYNWTGFGTFLDRMEEMRPSVNFGCLAGHGTVRIAVMGFSDRKADEEQRKKIHNLVAECMEEGAFGLSSGLIYPPGLFSDVEELAEAASAVVPYGGYYCTHMRNENVRLIPALEEALETARRSGAPLQVSHLKCTAKADWQVSAKTAVAMIQRARRQGMDVACDQYPYRATSTTITNNFPDWGFEGGMDRFLERLRDPEMRAKLCAQSDSTHIGRWHEIIVSWTQCPEDAWMCGLDMEEIGRRVGQPPVEALADLLLRAKGIADEIHYGMCEEDIEYILAQPFVMVGSDGKSYPIDQPGKPHPRAYGAFARVLSHYSRQRKVISLETAVAKMTGMPANRLGLYDRGVLRPGMRADLVLFDPDHIEDSPNFDQPQQACRGIHRVYVNGVLSAQDGQHTGARAGIVLRKGKNT